MEKLHDLFLFDMLLFNIFSPYFISYCFSSISVPQHHSVRLWMPQGQSVCGCREKILASAGN